MSFTQRSMFEALFERRLRPTGAFAAALAEAGYVRGDDTLKYPTPVWLACLELARAHVSPTLPRADAYRVLGREFAMGFLETSAGRLVAQALPLMPVESFLARLEAYFRIGREDTRLSFDLVEQRGNFARVTVHNPAGVPGTFVAGLIELAMERIGQPGVVEVRQSSDTDYELLVTW